jgi:hypothetical protein
VPLLTLSFWSRDWIGWWCMVPIVLSLVLIVQAAKAWYIDRQVLLFEEMKGRHDEYARWAY